MPRHSRRIDRSNTWDSRPSLRFEHLESRSMLAADSADFTTATAAECDPPTVDVSTVNGGFTCGLIAVDPPVTATPDGLLAPSLTYAEQGDHGFLIVHVVGTMTDGVPQFTMDIVAMRFNNTDASGPGEGPVNDSLFTQPDGESSTAGDTCVLFDAHQENAQPIPIDTMDDLAPSTGDGSFDLYMVIQSKSDVMLGLVAFAIAFVQSGGGAGGSSDTPQDGSPVPADDSQVPTAFDASLGEAGDGETNLAGAESTAAESATASACVVPSAPRAPLDSSLAAAASLNAARTGAGVEPQRPMMSTAFPATGSEPLGKRLSATSTLQQTQPVDHDERADSARDVRVEQPRRTELSDNADGSLADPLRPVLSPSISAVVGGTEADADGGGYVERVAGVRKFASCLIDRKDGHGA